MPYTQDPPFLRSAIALKLSNISTNSRTISFQEKLATSKLSDSWMLPKKRAAALKGRGDGVMWRLDAVIIILLW